MAMVFKGYRPRIAMQMANGDKELSRWLGTATYAKTSNGYWMAWHADATDRFLVLPPEGSTEKECHWIESWEGDYSVDMAFDYVESGRFERDEPFVLNLFIKDPVTGEWR
ncbi:hypothetical protein JWZ98_09980 [Methylomonas sp. EFPC1]|uniref:hypothetical protein n=1 Tax=unclassified Methylomonas TaxID=2608980 RepID=UPI000C325286|nr:MULTISPECIES: hypothetical protein [unclassified Methylomonas]PKD39553.1 hypothetical protein CWO84_14870 [Methylomonas sp. Kb3]QSB03226.1 hypothetical protein JWZ98_09980 [Methylomonas sp. EFPC1]